MIDNNDDSGDNNDNSGDNNDNDDNDCNDYNDDNNGVQYFPSLDLESVYDHVLCYLQALKQLGSPLCLHFCTKQLK